MHLFYLLRKTLFIYLYFIYCTSVHTVSTYTQTECIKKCAHTYVEIKLMHCAAVDKCRYVRKQEYTLHVGRQISSAGHSNCYCDLHHVRNTCSRMQVSSVIFTALMNTHRMLPTLISLTANWMLRMLPILPSLNTESIVGILYCQLNTQYA